MIKAEDFKWLDRVYHLFHLGSYLCLSGALTDCFLPLKLRVYLIHCSVYTLQCSSESSHVCSARRNTLFDPVNVPDESTLHRLHVLIPAKDSNKSLTGMFYKIVIVAVTPVDERVSHKLLFICQKHICWVKFFLHHT